MAVLACLASCTGEIGGGGSPQGTVAGTPGGGAGGGATELPNTGQTLATCQAATEAQTRLARLTHAQYGNTVSAILPGASATVSESFLVDAARSGFDNSSSDLQIEPRLFQDYQTAAEQLAAAMVADDASYTQLVTCTPGDACRDQLVSSFGRRAFRRPLTDPERQRYVALFDAGTTAGAAGDPFRAGVGLLVEAILQSPHFLYRTEFGESAAGGVKRLAEHELASRLSYALWNAPPDAELAGLADQGKLGTGDALRGQAQRLLGDQRALSVVDSFHRQHLGLQLYTEVQRDPARYPLFSAGLSKAMTEETSLFIRDVFQAGGGFGVLLTSPFSYVNQQTAPLYGLSGGFGAELTRVDLDPTKRAGLLTQLGFLTQNAHFDKTSPIHRGVFVLRKLLCATIPDPPANVDPTLPPLVGDIKTNRQAVERHTSPASCSGCHGLINPVGFAFEHYDAVGQYQPMDNATPVDASGSVQLAGAAVAFQNALELSSAIASSSEAQACYARHWLRYLYARTEQAADECVITGLAERMAASDYAITDLLADLTTTNAFMTVAQEAL
jgi:hypothetical protein